MPFTLHSKAGRRAAGTFGGLAFSLVVITWVTPLFLGRKKESGTRETGPSPTAAAS